jgi:hypothetical protein
MTPSDVARRATTGLVVVGRDGEVEWFDDAARALVEPYGGAWTGPASPVRPLRWPPPRADTRWWQVGCSVLDAATGAPS